MGKRYPSKSLLRVCGEEFGRTNIKGVFLDEAKVRVYSGVHA